LTQPDREIRLLILLDLRGGFFQAFWNTAVSPVDVIDDFALLIECTLQGRCTGLGLLELIAKMGIGLLEALPKTGLVAANLAHDEAEGGR
jgi:hypothetical protein